MNELFGNLPDPNAPPATPSAQPAMPSPGNLSTGAAPQADGTPKPVVTAPVQPASVPEVAPPVVSAVQQVASAAPAPAPVAPVVKTPEPEPEEEVQKPDELSMLKQRARLMGVNFSNNIGIEALRQKLQDKLEGKPEVAPELPSDEEVLEQAALYEPKAEKPMSLREKLLKENMRLIRLRITNLDPKKKDLPGEIITVANKFIGTVRKYVPFGEVTDNGYHVPFVIYKMLRKREFLNIRVSKRGGKEHVETNMAREFALEVLPPLTPAELAQLATTQQAQQGMN